MQQKPQTPANGAKLLAWRVAGLVSLALGIVGIALPLLPTTPFLLLSAFCFGRGSERLQEWLLAHPRLGPPIRDWRERGAISRRSKALASLAMILVLVTAAIMRAPTTVLITQAVVMVLVCLFIFTRPSSS
jgi:uncharacterized membrane protein YbaN (DUF454 family)